MKRPDTSAYLDLFLKDVPLIDLRAPVEFAKGAFPTAVNLPLMLDDERESVGIEYKEHGQEAAIRLGHSLVTGMVKENRLAAWKAFIDENPEGYLYCFRGGLRSQLSQQWMKEAGLPYPLVKGGYKALRRYLIDSIDEIVTRQAFFIIAGRTGVGKTDFLQPFPTAIDLEGLAQHRGSSFGRRISGQPTQINFENTLAIKLLKIRHGYPDKPILVEDESNRIGGITLPLSLVSRMKEWPLVILDEPLESRVERIHRDYVVLLTEEYIQNFGDGGLAAYGDFMRQSFARIKNRLGGVNYKHLTTLLEDALLAQEKGDNHSHKDWIRDLLLNYYDPMYDYQLSRKDNPIVFSGHPEEAAVFCREQCA
ncbi:tRNA 2-selenouridine synthase [Kordiimonas sediminis]|uniref:tRNA 2-selenouridine synthase n=1 Tax=Kordiimonas sediminis TaxID=1735581 RepID=A0A919AJQ4_9PROT|nr:tRNA 2-selenouridine(34) synthase MnmH [Kordiimonas sediminis]GHF11482.1 tRNA 2-selenouridine synthase [Kordiimonas sediminis]